MPATSWRHPNGSLKPVGNHEINHQPLQEFRPSAMYLCRPIPKDSMYTVYFPTFKVSLGSKMQVQYTIHRAYMATSCFAFRLDSGHVALGCCTSIPKPCACFCSCSTTWLGRSLDQNPKHFKPHRRIATWWPWCLFKFLFPACSSPPQSKHKSTPSWCLMEQKPWSKVHG